MLRIHRWLPHRGLLYGLVALGGGLAARAGESVPPTQGVWSPWRALGPLAYDWVRPEENARVLDLERFGLDGPGPDPDLALEGLRGGCRWEPLVGLEEASDLDVGTLDFTTRLPDGAGVSDARVFLHRTFRIEAPVSLPLALGSDDGLTLWWNGKRVLSERRPRALHLGDDQVVLEALAGVNHLLIEVSQKGGAWSFRMARLREADRAAIDDAIQKGVRWVLGHQRADGSWGTHPEYGGAHAAFAAYTLMKCGLSPNHPNVRMALAHAQGDRRPYTYAAASEVLALCQGPEIDRDWLEERVRDLVEWQASNGLYSYPTHPDGVPRAAPDLSNTLFAALALRAARSRGARVPRKTWQELLDGVLRYTSKVRDRTPPEVGFYYWPGAPPTGSMTGAGLSAIALCEEALDGKLPRRRRNEVERVKEAGLRWLGSRFDVASNPGGSGHRFFHLYGLERTASLLGVGEIGGRDWYEEGARWLINGQGVDGDWGNPAAVDTLLALLFLSRATAPRSGPRAIPPHFEVPAGFEEELLDFAREGIADRWPTKGRKVEASSELSGSPPERAFDTDLGTAWQPRADDPAPWIRISWRRPLRGGRIRLWHAFPRAAEDERARVVRAGLRLDGGEPIVQAVEPRGWAWAEFELPPGRFHSLELSILDTGPAEAAGRAVGFSEIVYRPER